MSRSAYLTAVVIAATFCGGCVTKPLCDCCQVRLSQIHQTRLGGSQS